MTGPITPVWMGPGIHGPKPVDPGPSGLVLVLGTAPTRSEKILEIPDQLRPEPAVHESLVIITSDTSSKTDQMTEIHH